ncbi:MAG: SH3 domain-containing protein, partial [Gammaproteobacteria bacterium]|nr:SH3 domain-containing protein [Gammaproteobacteria bacterium]
RGDADAQYSLGYLHEFGRGVANDRGEALRWYRAAAAQGHIEAGHRLDALKARLEAAASRIDVDLANLRAGPGTDHEVIDQLPRDTAVVDLARRGDWLEVSLPGRTPARGWLHRSLVDGPARPAPTPPAAQADEDALAEAERPVTRELPAPQAATEPADATDPTEAVEPAKRAAPSRDDASAPEAPSGPGTRQQTLAAKAKAAKDELKETLDERDSLLERLSSISRQTAALSAQIEEMEKTRNRENGGQTANAAPAAQPREPEPTAPETARTAPAENAPETAPSSSWLREGFAAMLDRLDGRLLEIESRLATLESNQATIARELRAARESRQTILQLAAELEKKLVAQRLETVEAQASEMSARLEMKKLEMQLNDSQIRRQDLERQLATRAADRDEQTQRLISLEEERDALMSGLDAAERRLAHLRDQIESDDPPRVDTAPLDAADKAR